MNHVTAYTAEVADRILHELRGGRTLRAVCRDPGMPDERTVRRWVSDDREGFAARYTHAREVGYHAMEDEMFEITDDSSNDSFEHRKKNGDVEAKPNPVSVSRARLRYQARRWMLSKGLPKIYGIRPDPNAGQLVRDTLASRFTTGPHTARIRSAILRRSLSSRRSSGRSGGIRMGRATAERGSRRERMGISQAMDRSSRTK